MKVAHCAAARKLLELAYAEDRFIDIGMAASGCILVVVHTETAERIRIISGRKATPSY
jgi:uncharacterized DUF497 family protein